MCVCMHPFVHFGSEDSEPTSSPLNLFTPCPSKYDIVAWLMLLLVFFLRLGFIAKKLSIHIRLEPNVFLLGAKISFIMTIKVCVCYAQNFCSIPTEKS